MTTHFDPTWELDRNEPDDASPPPRLSPVHGEVRQFTVSTMHRRDKGRFTLAAEDTMLSCGLVGAWLITQQPAGGWLVGETRTLPQPVAVSATWSDADGWRVTDVGTP